MSDDYDPFRIQRIEEHRVTKREWLRACKELGIDPNDHRMGFPDFRTPIREQMRKNNPGKWMP